ncbi:MAG: hypothetical protein AAF317_06575, partial [Pseudomonadota bacterium]
MLVVVADAPGDDWRLAPTPGPLAGAVAIGPATRVTLPEHFGGTTTNGRELRLTDRAARDGWRVSMDGLVAEGPFGLGRVFVLGIDPDAITAVNDEERESVRRERDAIWASVLAPVAMNTEDARAGGVRGGGRFGYYAFDDGPEGVAITEAINGVLRAEPVRASAFVFISVAFAVLGIIVSVVDPIVLKRARLRHRAWLTGLAWTALFGVGMAAVPGLIRDGRAEIGRRGLTDVVQSAPDPVLGTARAPVAAARTAVTTILTGSGSEALMGPQPPGHWLRGVGPSGYGYSYYDRQQTLPSLSMSRAAVPSAEGGLVPTSLLDVSGGHLADRDARVRQGVWTLRCLIGLDPMLDDRARELPVVEILAGEPPSVRVANLPDGWSGGLMIAGSEGVRVPLMLAIDGDTAASSELRSGVPLRVADRPRRGPGFDGPGRMRLADSLLGPATDMPLARARAAALDRYRSRPGSWAVVYLALSHDDEPGPNASGPDAPWDWFDPRSPGAADQRVTRDEAFRIAVPLSPAQAASLRALAGITSPLQPEPE